MLINNLAKALLVILVLSASTFSTDNLYVGVSMGQTSPHFKLNRDLAIERSDSSNLGKGALATGIFVGYNHLIQESPLFVGFEIGAQNHTLEVKKEENTFPPFVHYLTKVQTNNSLTAVAKIGIVVKDLLIYGKGGIARTNFKMNFADLSISHKPSYVSENFKKYGTILGFGVDYNINPNWGIGVDYTVANYSNLKLAHKVGNFKMSPSLRTTTFRLNYRF